MAFVSSWRIAWISALLLALVAIVPASAVANGDPASDILIDADAYYPYSPSVSPKETKRLDTILAQAVAKKVHMKVALIATNQDLGLVTSLWGKPATYAPFLAQEIAYAFKGPLIIVMPQGVAIHGGEKEETAAAVAAAPKSFEITTSSDDLAHAAGDMAIAYAKTRGITLTGIPANPKNGKAVSSLVTSIIIGVVVFVLLAAAALFASRASKEVEATSIVADVDEAETSVPDDSQDETSGDNNSMGDDESTDDESS